MLADLGPLRVWSLLVTVFGDLAMDQPMDGPTLTTIMARIGIKSEATRVALHRLRSDGWIVSRKVGRTSHHCLTDKGQRDSATARPRIYGAAHPQRRRLDLALLPDTEDDPDPSMFTCIAPRLFVFGPGTPVPEGAMHLSTRDLPRWLGPQIEPEALRDGYQALYESLRTIDKTLPVHALLSPNDAAVLRVMIVHAWRRLVLKHPDLPRAAHSAEWRGHDCRELVMLLLDRFPRPDPNPLKTI